MGETCCRRLYRDSEGPWAKKVEMSDSPTTFFRVREIEYEGLEFGKCRNWHPGQRAALSSFFATAAFVGRALLCSMQNTHLQREEGELGPRIRYLVPFLSLLCVFRQSRRHQPPNTGCLLLVRTSFPTTTVVPLLRYGLPATFSSGGQTFLTFSPIFFAEVAVSTLPPIFKGKREREKLGKP